MSYFYFLKWEVTLKKPNLLWWFLNTQKKQEEKGKDHFVEKKEGKDQKYGFDQALTQGWRFIYNQHTAKQIDNYYVNVLSLVAQFNSNSVIQL